MFEQAVRTGDAISMSDFSADLRYRLEGAWREAESVDFRGNNNKLATYQCLQVMRNVSRFRLRAHTSKVESAVWQDGNSVCVRIPLRCSFFAASSVCSSCFSIPSSAKR
eukprot:1161383-Pelagomonas_calceolata.AAC.15